ncbi:hypothetical protein D3C71_1085760 [compost metagenome]
MPLDGKHELPVRKRNGLNEPVLRQSDGKQLCGKLLDSLVMIAVDVQRFSPYDVVHEIPLFNVDLVHWPVMGRLLNVNDLRLRSPLGGKVLVQRSAKQDIEQLKSPANAEGRFIKRENVREQSPLQLIPLI